MINPERKDTAETTKLIAPEGLGFGEGGISVREQLKRGILTTEAPKHINELLTTDPSAFKSIEANDDGCGDGRPWTKIIQLTGEPGQKKIQLFKSSLLRAKVFGGGLVTASSMMRSIVGEPSDEETIGDDLGIMSSELQQRNFDHGAHSDDNAGGLNCGCGAIDNYQLITANAVKYSSEITATLEIMYGDTFQENKEAIKSVLDTYRSLVTSTDYFSNVSGKQSMAQILQSGAIVKELTGRHVEETIVLNDVAGTTLDQLYFTQQVKNACTEELKPQTIQAFSVDIWRGREIADIVTDIACEQDPSKNPEKVHQLAYADFLIRTLAVAATLTAGDLPVYLRQS